MSDSPLQSFIKKNRPQFTKYKNYIEENDWTLTKPMIVKKRGKKGLEEADENSAKVMHIELDARKEEATLQGQLVNGILDRIKYFSNKFAADSTLDSYRTFMRNSISIINLFINKAEDYINSVDISSIPYSSLKTDEIAFHNQLFKTAAGLQDKIIALNFNDSDNAEVGIEFFNDMKAPLSMHLDLVAAFPEIEDKVNALGIDFKSPPKNEMLINIPNPPKYNSKKHYWEQEKETLQFYVDEFKKIRDGVFIDGVFISPWMYYHINIFTTSYPVTKINKFTGDMETEDVIGVPPLRDNEWWIIQDNYLEAKKKGLMLFIAATRRAAKTTMIASHLAWCQTIGKRRLLCAGGSAKDLGQIKDNFIIDSLKKNIAFRTPNLINDWSEEVEYGIKNKNGKNIVLSMLKIVNLNKGGEKSSELLAGFTPDAFVLDEIMKAPFLDQLAAVKPALDQPGGKRCVGILSGTSGNEELAKDAFTVLNNPEANDVLQMDFELFDSRVPEQHRTWRRRNFGTFIPAQMSAKEGLVKLDSNLAEFLGKKGAKGLEKIKIKTTDWEHANEVIKKDRQKKAGDQMLLTKEILYHPIDPEELFLSGKVNPFPVAELKKRKEELLATGDFGKKVTLVQDNSGKISYTLNNNPLPDYPYKGGFIDSPVVLYEDLPEEKPANYLYVGGFDDYKSEESGGDSVGSFHIYKVNIGVDKWCGRIVASYASRPDPHQKLYRQIFLLMQAFNAMCFFENMDAGFKDYLDRRRVTEDWLVKAMDFKSDMAYASSGRRAYGWTPTPANIKYMKNLAINYTREEFTVLDENGREITILGAQKINDLGLIQEMIDYREGNNVDRITSFMSCLAYESYLHQNYLLPVPKKQQTKTEEKKENTNNRNLAQRMFGKDISKRRLF